MTSIPPTSARIAACGTSSQSSPPPAVETLRARFQRGVSWSMAAAVATSGLNFLVNIVVARLLGRIGFGEFGTVQTTIATVAGIAQLGMGYTATKFVAEFRSSDPVRAGRIIGLCSTVAAFTAGLAAASLFLWAPWLASVSLKAPALSVSLQLSVGTVYFSVLPGYQTGTLAGLESYRRLAALALLGGVLNLLTCLGGARLWGLNGAIAGMGLSAFCQWLIFRAILHSECRRAGIAISRKEMFGERFVFLSFALPAALSGFSSMPALWLANAFLVRQTNGFSEMALYAAALNVRSFVFFLPSLVNRVSMSLLNNQRGLRNWKGYGRVFKTNVALTGGSVVCVAAVVALVGVPVLGAFGKEFRAGYPVLLVVLLSSVPEVLAMAIVQVVHSESRLWLSLFAIALPKDCTLVVLAYLLTPRYGAVGLAVAYSAAWFLTIVTVVITARVSWPVPRQC